MSEQLPEETADVEVLWSLALRWNDDEPWLPYGTHNADGAAILRTYDFPAEGMENVQMRIHKTTVIREVAGVDELRKKVEEASAAKKGAAVQSE